MQSEGGGLGEEEGTAAGKIACPTRRERRTGLMTCPTGPPVLPEGAEAGPEEPPRAREALEQYAREGHNESARAAARDAIRANGSD